MYPTAVKYMNLYVIEKKDHAENPLRFLHGFENVAA